MCSSLSDIQLALINFLLGQILVLVSLTCIWFFVSHPSECGTGNHCFSCDFSVNTASHACVHLDAHSQPVWCQLTLCYACKGMILGPCSYFVQCVLTELQTKPLRKLVICVAACLSIC